LTDRATLDTFGKLGYPKEKIRLLLNATFPSMAAQEKEKMEDHPCKNRDRQVSVFLCDLCGNALNQRKMGL